METLHYDNNLLTINLLMDLIAKQPLDLNSQERIVHRIEVLEIENKLISHRASLKAA